MLALCFVFSTRALASNSSNSSVKIVYCSTQTLGHPIQQTSWLVGAVGARSCVELILAASARHDWDLNSQSFDLESSLLMIELSSIPK